jgi:hypothetical protein
MFRRLAVLLLAVLVPAFALVACGGEDEPTDVEGILAKAFGGDEPLRSAQVRLVLDADLRGVAELQGPLRATLSGPFRSNGEGKLPDLDLDLRLQGGQEQVGFGLVFADGRGFQEVQGQAFELERSQVDGLRRQLQQGDREGEPSTLGGLGIDPRRWLADARKAGEEDVDGTATTHVAAAVDVPRFLQDLSRLLERARGAGLQGSGVAGADQVPQGLSAAQREEVARAIRSAKVDVWAAKEDTSLRRVRLDVALDVPQASRRKVGGLAGGRITLDLRLDELDDGQEIRPPEGARPIRELAGALGATGATGAGAGAAAAPPVPAAPQPYLECLERAGEDLREVQACAPLLQP